MSTKSSSSSSSTAVLGGAAAVAVWAGAAAAVAVWAATVGGGRRLPAMKSLMILGVAVSNPARLSVFRSLGSAIVRQFDVIPTTMSLASIPITLRYSSSAACGWIVPIYVSLSV